MERVDSIDSGIVSSYELGNGESESISLAMTLPNSVVILDDVAARACARELDVDVLGAGGFLLIAKRRGLIDSLSNALEEVQNAGLWISPAIIELLLERSGEK